MHLDILPGKRIRFAIYLILNISELNSDVYKHQVISANHAGTPLYVSHNIRGMGGPRFVTRFMQSTGTT